jgi:adenylyltransferase/sulfurtransferase
LKPDTPAPTPEASPPPLSSAQAERYSRQIQLPQIGASGQQQLLAARALVIGMGGLGAPVAMYLAAAGVGHLVISDYDQVELSNLQRQIIHRNADIGRLKTDSARDHLLALNPDIRITALSHSLADEELQQQVEAADVVIDCSDNFSTRFGLNRLCVASGTPLVSGAGVRMEGQVTVFLNDGSGPCYHCLYQDNDEQGDSCAQIGVLAPLVGAIGSLQAIETIKLLTGIGESLSGYLLVFDALDMEWRKLRLRRDPDCPTCAHH